MQDFPKKKQNDKDCDFESTLVDYVSRLGISSTIFILYFIYFIFWVLCY